MRDCIFCKIIAGEIPSYKIYEDKYTYAFLDIAGDAVGHTLVIPKKHYTNVLDIPEKEYINVMKTVKKISEHYVALGYTGVNIMNASGKDAQQTVFHLHFHIIPRKQDDGLDTWPKLTNKEIDFQQVAEQLKIN